MLIIFFSRIEASCGEAIIQTSDKKSLIVLGYDLEMQFLSSVRA